MTRLVGILVIGIAFLFAWAPGVSAQTSPTGTTVDDAICVVVTSENPTVGEPAAVYFDFAAAPYSGQEGNEVYVYGGESYLNQGTPSTGDSVAIALEADAFDNDGTVAVSFYTEGDFDRYDCTPTVTDSAAPLCTVTTDATVADREHAVIDFDFSDQRLSALEGGFVYIFSGGQYATHGEPVQGERFSVVLPDGTVEADGSVSIVVQTDWPRMTIPCSLQTVTPDQPLCVVTLDTTPSDGEAAIVTYNFDSPLYAANDGKQVVMYSGETYASHTVATTGTVSRFRVPNGAVQTDGSVSFRVQTSEPYAWAACQVEQLDAQPTCTVTTDTTPTAGERVMVEFDFSDPRVNATPGQVAYIYGDTMYAGYAFPRDGDVVTVTVPDDAILEDGEVSMRVLLSEHWAWSDCDSETVEPGYLCTVDAGPDPQDGDTAVISFDFTEAFYASSDQGNVYMFSGERYLGDSRPTTGSTIDIDLPEGSVNPDGSVRISARTSTPVAWSECFSPATREAPEPVVEPTTATTAPATTTSTTAAPDDSPETTSTESTTESTSESEEQASSDPKTHEIPDAGLGEGAACQATIAENMLPRAAIEPDLVTEPTQAYTASFSTDDGMFKILSGSWSVSDGIYKQHNNCGYDYTALLRTRPLANYRFEATFAAMEGVNQGGMILGLASEDSRSGAAVVDLSDGGDELRWGYYNEVGVYQQLGSSSINGPGPGEWVRLKADVVDGIIKIELNGVTITEFAHDNTAGHVGLVSSVSVVGFDDVTLTALPSEQ